MTTYFEGFETTDVDAHGIRVRARIGGSGPPLLLLHGAPETHLMWHKVAGTLAAEHTIVATDLRGYGDSDKPAAGPGHAEYSKRAMAADQVAVMDHLGFDRFALAGHDRGARVAHRLCLDHPGRVERVAMLDVVPTRHVLGHVDRDLAFGYYHWFFFAQPADLPERLIGGDPEYFLRRVMSKWTLRESPFDDDVFADYLRCFRDPAMLSATCEDFRAAASIDLEHDEESQKNGIRITAPLLAIWGNSGFVGQHYDVLDVWRQYADDVRGHGLDCGHFMPEEEPDGTAAALAEFFR